MSGQQTEQALGKYAILRELGRGGFATVYLAQDTVLRRSIALKILHPVLLADPDFVRRFEQEAHATAQLDHPHIATIYELGQLEGRLYIAIQLLAGGTLADRIRQRGPLPFAETARVVGEIAEALDHAHAAGFVHRDVKPTNILFNARDEAVLTDFGMVKAVESSVIARSTMGNVIGTPPYIAPEIWEGKQDGPGTDVYALGCVLFEMLTGELLFKGNTPPAVMLAHFQRHQYPARWPEGAPPQIEALLERALSRDRTDRHASAGALAADLRDLAALAADPLAERYRALQAAIAAQDWERASQLAQEIAAQNPDYRDVPALALQAAEGQTRDAQSRQVAQWRDAALEAERSGQVDAARVAARRWLDVAPGDMEAQALLGRLDAITETKAEAGSTASVAGRAAPAKSVWWTVGPIAIGWGAGWLLSLAIGRAAESVPGLGHDTASITGWAFGWAVTGLLTGLALRWAVPAVPWRQVLMLAAGWSLCLTIGLLLGDWIFGKTFSGGWGTELFQSAVGMAIGVTLAGLVTGAVLRSSESSVTWGRVLLLAIIGGVGWFIVEMIQVDENYHSPWRDVFYKLSKLHLGFGDAFDAFPKQVTLTTLTIGGVISAIAAGGVMLWLLSRARRDGQQRN